MSLNTYTCISAPQQGEVMAVTVAPGTAAKVKLSTMSPVGYGAALEDPFFCNRFATIHASGGAAVFALVEVDAAGPAPADLAPAFVPGPAFAMAPNTGQVLPADVSVDCLIPSAKEGFDWWLLVASSAGCQIRVSASSAKI